MAGTNWQGFVIKRPASEFVAPGVAWPSRERVVNLRRIHQSLAPMLRAYEPGIFKGYLPTQVIAELFKSIGYDGIAYRSCTEDKLAPGMRDECVPFNVAIFDPSNVRQCFEGLVKISSVDVKITEGPHC